MGEHTVAHESELDEGERVIAQIEGREVAVFNVDGSYYAYNNWCVHQGGPVCEGALTGTVDASFDREGLRTDLAWNRDGEILKCPWHRWEYDVLTGECLSRDGLSLLSYPVKQRDGDIVVEL